MALARTLLTLEEENVSWFLLLIMLFLYLQCLHYFDYTETTVVEDLRV